MGINRTLEIGWLAIPVPHAGISDLNAYASTKRAGQADRLKDASLSSVSSLDVNGRNALRYTATGSLTSGKYTFVVTLIEGRDQIVMVSAFAGATNAQEHISLLESLAGAVSGIQ
jgi:hypothetical protein